MVRNCNTGLGHKSSYWDYFDETIKLTGFIECAKVICYSQVSFYGVLKKRLNYGRYHKKLKAFQVTRTFTRHLLNLADCAKQTPK